MHWKAFWLTMRLTFSVTALLLIIGFPLEGWIAFSKWRWKFLVEKIVGSPIVLRPTALGLYVLIVLGQHSPRGRWWHG
jgi:molybdate transport system permease protein